MQDVLHLSRRVSDGTSSSAFALCPNARSVSPVFLDRRVKANPGFAYVLTMLYVTHTVFVAFSELHNISEGACSLGQGRFPECVGALAPHEHVL